MSSLLRPHIPFGVKYFSSLERLRFAQINSEPTNTTEIGVPVRRKPSLADRRGIKSPLVDSSRHFGSRAARRSGIPLRQHSNSSADASWFLTLPDRIKKRELARDQRSQSPLADIPRDTVVLYDAADQNIHKASRRSRILQHNPSSTPRKSMESTRSADMDTRPTSMTRAMLENFRWMDEEEDLDLRLVLDDYHANIDGAIIPLPHTSHPQRPSFRRHMSISKSPFGRTSFSSLNTPSPERSMTHVRQKSRTMSLMGPISPRHATKDSVSSIDPHATHYQDPEARLKLRVYLASPQKFDEAIEFGFPSMENEPDKENKTTRKVSREIIPTKSPVLASDSAQTFLNDDNISLSSNDDVSMIDPDSPLTPAEVDTTFKSSTSPRLSYSGKRSMSSSNDYAHLGIKKPVLHKHRDSLAQQIAGNREMTLRMTLTRPDLRADESQLYGWQEKEVKEKPRGKSPLADEGAPSESHSSDVERFEKMGPFGGIDGWGPVEKEGGVVKRLWNRVRSGQRKL